MYNGTHKKKLAIIGASYLQAPLILKAKEMGIETHVFAWAAQDVGEKIADYFYPISIMDKELILKECQKIHIDGICTIASDLATIAVSYVAEKMGLEGNPIETSLVSTNKHKMRLCFELHNDPSPRSILVENVNDLKDQNFTYPVIVKPLDRSGSRGIVKVDDPQKLGQAIEIAMEQGFMKKALVEDFVDGKEYSVECISWNGKHEFLAITEKYTTGAPHFIETGHIQPAGIGEQQIEKVKNIVFHALNSLNIRVGASHSEIKITEEGKIYIIEIGARMGGDFIGSHLVELSTGVDYVKCVIECALGKRPEVEKKELGVVAGVRFAMDSSDCKAIRLFKKMHPEKVVIYEENENDEYQVTDSSNRKGYCLASFDNRRDAVNMMRV